VTQALPRRSPVGLALRSLLAALWFETVFFLAFPAGVLWLAGTSLAPPGGAAAWVGGALIAGAHLGLLVQIPLFVRSGHGTHTPLDPPVELVRAGLYRFTRNPMYLLYAVVVLGEAVLYRSPALLGYAVFFAGLAHLYVVGREERQLARRFGPAYERYCREVPRWLPLPGRR